MIEVKRKKGETFDALLRRFQRRYQESGKNIELKKRRFLERHKNRNKRRESALYRVDKREKFAYLAKTGQLPEEPRKRMPRRG